MARVPTGDQAGICEGRSARGGRRGRRSGRALISRRRLLSLGWVWCARLVPEGSPCRLRFQVSVIPRELNLFSDRGVVPSLTVSGASQV